MDYEKDKCFMENFNLNVSSEFFQGLKKKNYLLSVGLDRSDEIYVGWIKKIYEKSISLNTIGTHTEDTGMMNIPFDRIRFINIDTDYLNSLNLYMEIKKETQP